MHTQPAGVPAQGDGVAQRGRGGGDHHLVWPDAAAQHRFEQRLPLGHGEGWAFAGGAKQGDAVAAGFEHALGVGNGQRSVEFAVGQQRQEQGGPEAVDGRFQRGAP